MTGRVSPVANETGTEDRINAGPRLSVVVCTYNRAALLGECLASLAGQTSDASVFEVIIVDNNSRDETEAVAQRFCTRAPNFRYVVETEQGLSHARNRGLAEARGNFVAYIDDDAKAAPGWTAEILRFFDEVPEADAVGGPYLSHALQPLPEWFPPEYGTWSLGEGEAELQAGQSLQGTNMIFRQDVLARLNGFSTRIGMAGAKLSYGEETHLMYRMHELGNRIFYSHSIVVSHAILGYKLSLWWLLRSVFANGRSGIPLYGPMGGRLRSLLRLGKTAAQGLVRFFTLRERHIKTRVYRAFSPTLWQLGFVVALFEQRR